MKTTSSMKPSKKSLALECSGHDGFKCGDMVN